MKISIRLKTLWTISLILYIICSSAFSYGELRRLNSLALYFFLGVSALNILQRRRIRLDFAAVTVIVYLLLSLVGMIYTPTASEKVWEVMYNYITMSVLAVCIVQYIDDIRDVHIIIHAYMVAGLALAIYVYSLYGSDFWEIMREAANTRSGSVVRLGSELTNVNTISLCTAISAIIAVYYLVYARTSKIRAVVCSVIAVFCFMVSMAAGSKKSIILIVVCMIAVWLYNMIGTHNFQKQLRNVLLLLGSAMLLLWMINTLPIFSGIAKRIESLFSFFDGGKGTTSEIERFTLLVKGFSVWTDHPFFGAGTASSIFYFGAYSHNNYIEILMNSGFVGFCVFYSVYVYAANKYMKNAVAYRTMDKLSILLFALFLGVTVIGFAMVYYYDRYYMFLMTTAFSSIRVYGTEIQTKKLAK